MFGSWIRRLFPTPSRQARRVAKPKPMNRARLGVEDLEGRAMPSFLTPVSYSTGTNPGGIAVGDYNGDGRDDMAVVSQAIAGTVGVLLSNADGSFQPRVDYASGANSFDASSGDLNGDGKRDLAVVGSGTVNSIRAAIWRILALPSSGESPWPGISGA